MKRPMLALIVALAVVAVACGTDESDNDAEGSGSDPEVSAQCTQDAPDCEDTLVGNDSQPAANDEEPPIIDNGDGTGASISGGMFVDGGLSVADALTTDAVGVIAIRGFIVADATAVRLCELLAESLPPQCSGAAIVLVGVSADGLDALAAAETLGFKPAEGIRWPADRVTFFGEIVNGEFVIDGLVSG